MTNLTAQNNSTADGNGKQASICFCIHDGNAPQRPSVSLQLSDLTKTFRA